MSRCMKHKSDTEIYSHAAQCKDFPSGHKRLRQGISNVVICVYLSYFHISSDEMEVAKNMIGSLMRSRFLCLHNGSIVITTEFLASDMLEITLGSGSAIVSCFELFQLTVPLLRQNTKPDCDHESSLSVWKLASV
ncbi:hypothetical protein V6N12_065700 [Hibiscus sabdariffa]|uniref:Uncharacterized protein n=1 Tax=Hibiscus sabdariffa TaxID=183260 RepID=A0ABR2G9G8_9ROSI